MNQEPENLLESDRLEDVLDEPGPPQPVVVVQYRTRVVPGLLIVGLVLALAMGILFVHHRREVERLRAQTLEARRDLQRLMETNRVEERRTEPRAADPPATAALDPSPPDAAAARPIAISVGDGSSAATQPPTSTVAANPPDSAKPPEPANPPEPVKADPAMDLARLPGKADPTPASGPQPAAPTGPTDSVPSSPAPSPNPAAPVNTAAKIPDSPSPFDELPEAGGDSRADGPAGAAAPATASTAVKPPETAGSIPGPAGPAALAAEPPLPSKEETERQILEEAARKQLENDQRLTQQQQDLQDLKEEDRRRFRDELRMILNVHGKRAGTPIEELSVRAGRDDDPARRARAYRVIGTSGTSQRTKVQQLRAIGVPESVILDYLANGLNKNLGTRNGPRSRNEIWIQAAHLLLSYEMAPARQRPAGGPDAPDGRGRRAANRPTADRRPAGGAPRTP